MISFFSMMNNRGPAPPALRQPEVASSIIASQTQRTGHWCALPQNRVQYRHRTPFSQLSYIRRYTQNRWTSSPIVAKLSLFEPPNRNAIGIPRQAASSTPNLSIDILSPDRFQYVIWLNHGPLTIRRMAQVVTKYGLED